MPSFLFRIRSKTLAAMIAALLAFFAPVWAAKIGQGGARRPDLEGALDPVDQRLHRRGRWRALLRCVDQRHRPVRSHGTMVEDRQGPAGVEPARAVQATPRSRSAHDRPSAVFAAPASRRSRAAAGHDGACVDPARIARQSDHQAIRRAGTCARRACSRRRRAPRPLRQGDPGAAFRGPRPQRDITGASMRRASSPLS